MHTPPLFFERSIILNTSTIKYRGVEVTVNEDALASFRVQKAIAQMQTNAGRGFDALDEVFNQKLDDIIDKIPDEDGKPYKYGAPIDVVVDLITKAIENSDALKKE